MEFDQDSAENSEDEGSSKPLGLDIGLFSQILFAKLREIEAFPVEGWPAHFQNPYKESHIGAFELPARDLKQDEWEI